LAAVVLVVRIMVVDTVTVVLAAEVVEQCTTQALTLTDPVLDIKATAVDSH
jgi:hypothetical protein